jgi:hypothetical protein
LLSERIMYDLKHPIAVPSNIADWEANDNRIAITKTLHSYRQTLVSVKDWLSPSNYFPKLLKNCFDLTVQLYVESFYSNTMIGTAMNPSAIATNLNIDYLTLVSFFNGSIFEEYQDKDGFYSTCEVNRRLQVIQCISRLLNPNVPPSELEDDTARLLTDISHDTGNLTAAILHIAGLRSSHCDGETIEWIQMISNAEKSIKERQVPDHIMIQLPDLRNSPFVRKIQEQQHSTIPLLHRHISHIQQFRFYRKSSINLLYNQE